MQESLAEKVAKEFLAHEDESPMEEMQEEMGIGPEAQPDEFEVQTTVEELLETMSPEEAEAFADEKMNMWRGVHHELNNRKQG